MQQLLPVYFAPLMPSESMIPAMRLVSSSTNFLYWSPLRKIGDHPSLAKVDFQAADSVAPRIILISASRCWLVIPGAPKVPRQFDSSTLMPCSLSVGNPSTRDELDTASARM